MNKDKITPEKVSSWIKLFMVVAAFFAIGCKAFYDIKSNRDELEELKSHNEKRIDISIVNDKGIAVMRIKLEVVQRQNAAILVKQDKQAEKIDELKEMIIKMRIP